VEAMTAISGAMPTRRQAFAGLAIAAGGATLAIATLVLAIVDHESLPWKELDGSTLPGLSLEWTYVLRLGLVTLSTIVTGAIAGLIVWRQPRNAFTWAFATFAILYSFDNFTIQYAIHGLNVAPDSLPLADMAARLQLFIGMPFIISAVSAVFLFPDGRLRSSRWAAAIVLMLLLQLGDIALNTDSSYFLEIGVAGKQGVPVSSLAEWRTFGQALGWLRQDMLPFVPGTALFWGNNLLAILVGAAVLTRLRSASGEARLQVKWFAYAVTFGAIAFVLSRTDWLAAILLSDRLPVVRQEVQGVLHPIALWAEQAFNIGLGLLMPLTIGIAIMRYRLYDIDLVISRTIIYGGIAAFVTLCYGVTVGAAGSLVGETAGRGPVITLVAIAVIASLLEPVRARLNAFANIAIYGKRANPYEILSEFARGVGQAESADVLLPRMAQLVRDGTGASLVEVWVRVGERLRLAAASPDPLAVETLADAKDLAARAGPSGTVVPVFHDNEQLGALVVQKPRGDPLTPTEARLLSDLASQAGLVFGRFRLFEELRESRARIIAAQDDERRRIERDLHDGAQQRFVNAMLNVGMAQAIAGPTSQTSDLLQHAAREMQAGLSELRDLARGIHPPLLTESGLHAAVASLADRSPIETSVVGVPDRRYAEPIEVTAYFVVAEALANAAKHSHASSIKIRIDEQAGRLRVEVSDDGVGGVDSRHGSGLVGLRDRTAAIGGSLNVESPNGHGTVVRAELPCG
jgi:signal transduction histidine kinase